jgi:hypothetical protein
MRQLFVKELGSRPALLAYFVVVWCDERKVELCRGRKMWGIIWRSYLRVCVEKQNPDIFGYLCTVLPMLNCDGDGFMQMMRT